MVFGTRAFLLSYSHGVTWFCVGLIELVVFVCLFFKQSLAQFLRLDSNLRCSCLRFSAENSTTITRKEQTGTLAVISALRRSK